ncbi:MAG TPA: tyrosine-type recombinase/integrase, partial [Polyangiales bacterium]|nr:tyrosine-type recombinase/integrase [Polyangiales bacterium]
MALEAVGVKPPKIPELAGSEPRERWLTWDEQVALLAQIMPRWRDHVVMYLQLGLSKSELFRVLPEHVDLARNVVQVKGTKAKARNRSLPMPADVREIVERKLRSAKRGEPLFERWNPGNADRHLRLAAERAGLGPISFNDLRRTFATVLARDGWTALQLRPLMGHSTTRMLDQHYARMG